MSQLMKCFWGFLMSTNNFHFVWFLLSDFLILWLFGVILSFFFAKLGRLLVDIRAKLYFWGLLIWTDNFHYVRLFIFWLFLIFAFKDLLPFLGHFKPFLPHWAIFGVGVGSKYRLTNFVIKVSFYLCFSCSLSLW